MPSPNTTASPVKGWTEGVRWVAYESGSGRWSVRAELPRGGVQQVARVLNQNTETGERVARLIGAAPELAEALERLIYLIDANPNAEPGDIMMAWRTGHDGEAAARAALKSAGAS